MNESFVLKGLDGTNPLGFLAALGLMSAIRHGELSDVKMSWQRTVMGWRPVLYGQKLLPLTKEDIIPAVSIWLNKTKQFSMIANHPNRKNGKGTGVGIFSQTFSSIATLAMNIACTDGDRSTVDVLAAIGNEMISTHEKESDDGPIDSTALRATRSHEFLNFAVNIEQDTTVEHIEKTLFKVWGYDDPIETHSMRWDPLDDSRSRYALRWDNPGDGNPERKRSGAMWGANRLALEAFALLPTAPCKGHLETTGFRQHKKTGILWSWPIWTVPINLDVIRSILSLSVLQLDRPNRKDLQAIGIEDVYRCQRINKDKYRNFSQAVPV